MIPLGVLASARVAAAGGSGVAYLTATTASTGTTTRTYASLSLGNAASNRNIIIAVHSRAGGAATAATIGGVTATLHASFTDSFAHLVIFSAVVPSGTTGSAVVTFGSNPEATTVGVWSAYGTLAYSTNATNGAGTTVTLTAPSNALVIAGMTQLASPTVGSWTIATIEDYGVAHPSSMLAIGGHDQPAAGIYTVTVTSAYTNHTNSALMAVAFTLT